MSSRSFSDLTHPVLVKLAREVGETALIGCLEPQSLKAVYIDKAESESAVRYTVPIGKIRDLHCSSVGKLIMAYRPDIAERVLKMPRLTRYTGNTIVDKKTLALQLRQIRTNGISKSSDEATSGAAGMAAPILNAAGDFIAGLVVAGPTQRIHSGAGRIERELRAAAAELSESLPDTDASQISLAAEDLVRMRA